MEELINLSHEYMLTLTFLFKIKAKSYVQGI